MKNNKTILIELPENIVEDTNKYAQSLKKYLTKRYNEIEFRAQRVPMGIYEQRKAGSYMVRIRIPAGIVLLRQILKIAELSEKFGDGVIHVTTRQDLQIHNVKIENTLNILRELLDVGLSPRGGGGNTIRNITTCPFSGLCPYEKFDVTPFALGLTELLISDESSFNLPRKFKIGFSGCQKDCGFVSVADCSFFAHTRNGNIGFSVYAGGGLGPHARVGVKIEDFIEAWDVYLVAEAVKRVFDRYGDRKNKHKARLRYVVERFGEKNFVREYRKELENARSEKKAYDYKNFFDKYRLPLFDSDNVEYELGNITGFKSNRTLTLAGTSSVYRMNLNVEEFPSSIRKYMKLIYKEKFYNRYSIKIVLKNGNIPSEKLTALVGIAERYGYGFLRTSQFQNLFLCGIRFKDLEAVFSEIEDLKIPAYNYSGVDIVSCAGASTCKLGLCFSRRLADELDKLFNSDSGIKIDDFVIRISGCMNGCGHHYIGDIGFQGGARRIKSKLMPFYDVFIGASSKEGKASLGEDIGSLPAKAVPEFLNTLIKHDNFLDAAIAKDVLVDFLNKLDKKYPDNNFPDDYYVDIGSKEKFSLAGRGPGECGAGVLDVVKLDIENSKSLISEAMKQKDKKRKNEAIYNAILSASRALLVLFGEEPERDYEVFNLFKKYLIDEGWVQRDADDLISLAMGYRMNEVDSLEDALEEAKDIVKRVEELFYSLDSNLKFNISSYRDKDKIEKQEEPSLRVDLRGVKCPMNFVKTKLALDKIKVGEICEIILEEGEPIENVPLSVQELGHKIIEKRKVENYYIMKVLKK